MKNRSIGLMVALAFTVIAAPASLAGQDKPAVDANTVHVTVKYTGKGTVDAKHQLWIWLFTSPDIGPGSEPIGEMALDKNGSSATFPGVTEPTVWIAVAYDEAGGFLGQSPPPPGSPIAIHSQKSGAPIGVTPGPDARVTITFDDSRRMQ